MPKNESVQQKMFASIASWQASDLSQKEWCRQQEITYHIFHYWYKRYREQQESSGEASAFARLAVKQEPEAGCEVIFADGTKVIFRQSVSVQYLKSLLF